MGSFVRSACSHVSEQFNTAVSDVSALARYECGGPVVLETHTSALGYSGSLLFPLLCV